MSTSASCPLPIRSLRALGLVLPLALAACHAGGTNGTNIPGDRKDTSPYDGIATSETVHFLGTEPFWGGQVAGGTLRWETPENPKGEDVTVTRLAGRGGLSYSGVLGGKAFTLAVSPGQCSDGMSDRSFPFLVMVRIGEAVREGCGWTDKQPYKGATAP